MRYSMILVFVFVSGISLQPVQVFGQTATLSLRARKHNNTLFGNDFASQVSSVSNVTPGDTIEMDMWVSGFDDVGFNGVRAYQIIMDCATYITDDCGALIPLGWDAPIIRESCSEISVCSTGSSNQGENCGSDSDCPEGTCLPSSECNEPYPICNPVNNIFNAHCTGVNFDARMGAFVKQEICSAGSSNAGDYCEVDGDCTGGTCVFNNDFIFASVRDDILVVNVNVTALCAYTFGGATFSLTVSDDATQRYLGTMIYHATVEDKGTFNIGIIEEVNKSFLTAGTGAKLTLIADPLSISMAMGCPLPDCYITDSLPGDCGIDARYPWDPTDQNEVFGWDFVDLTFFAELLNGCNVSAITKDNFIVTIEGGFGIPPTVTEVTPINDDTVRVTLARPIRLERWTCLTYAPAEPGEKNKVCLGRLPADSNADLMSDGNDIASLIENLNGKPFMEIWQCDMDRNGNCGVVDLLAAIDMLNGAREFVPFMNKFIDVSCPSAPSP